MTLSESIASLEKDPKAMAKPYSYTRYYKKLDTEIMDDPCEDQE